MALHSGGSRAAQSSSAWRVSLRRQAIRKTPYLKRPFLRAMQVVDVGLIDGEAERGDVPGDTLGTEQNIIGEALYRLVVVGRTAIMSLRGLMLLLVLAAAFVRGFASGGGDDGGVIRP